MPTPNYEANFNGLKTSVADFNRPFTFNATGLIPNTYYDVVCESSIKNNCALQSASPPGTPSDQINQYQKNVTRFKEFESTGINLITAGKVEGVAPNLKYKSLADLPLKSGPDGKLTFTFDGSSWLKDGGSGSSTSTTQDIGIINASIATLYAQELGLVYIVREKDGEGYYHDSATRQRLPYQAGGDNPTSYILRLLTPEQLLEVRRRTLEQYPNIDKINTGPTDSSLKVGGRLNFSGGDELVQAGSQFTDPNNPGIFGAYWDEDTAAIRYHTVPFAGSSTPTNGFMTAAGQFPFASSWIKVRKATYVSKISMNVTLARSSFVEEPIIPVPIPVTPVLNPPDPIPEAPAPVPIGAPPAPPPVPVPVPPPPPANTVFDIVDSTAANTDFEDTTEIASDEVSVASNTVVNTSILFSPPTGWSVTKPDLPSGTSSQQLVSSTTSTASKDLGILKTSKQFGTGGQTPLSEVSLYFDYAQTFYLNPSFLDGSQHVTLTSVELFFATKPHRKRNQSNIVNPGVYIFVCDAENDKPNLSRAYRESIVRLNYDQINPSLDSKNVTEFTFKSPITLKTGKQYAIVINFEDPQYSLWTATQGRSLIGSNFTCDNAYNEGKLYRASNYLEIDSDPTTRDDVLKAIPSTDLKFKINALQYKGFANIELVNDDYEFLEVDLMYSPFLGYVDVATAFASPQRIYQDFGAPENKVYYFQPGNLNVRAPYRYSSGLVANEKMIVSNNISYTASQLVVGAGTKFLSVLDIGDEIVISDGVSDARGNVANTCIRRVKYIFNDTKLILDSPCSFSSETTRPARYKFTAMATYENYLDNPPTLILNKSNASRRVRFINNGVNYISFTGGTGYANTDYITFSGTGATKNGRASIQTYANGTIESITIHNAGEGFTGNPVATIRTSAGVSGGSGSGAIISASKGAQVRSEFYGAVADVTNVIAFPITSFIPNFDFNKKAGSISSNRVNFAYYDADQNYYDFNDSNFVNVIDDQSTEIESYNAVILSKSLEILNTSSLTRTSSEGKSSVVKFSFSATNQYESPELHRELSQIYVFSNLINNDATDEYSGQGNAVARHITKKITFDKDRFAEDIRVIATAWKPSGTDVKIYARCHNSKDEDAFDDKDWSELEIKDATFDGKQFSNKANKKDYVELTYGFRAYPEIGSVLVGDAFVYSAAGNTTVTGVGTSFNTDLANGDMIVLYDTQFPNTTYGVAVVANTPTATAFEINRAFGNLSLEAASLKVGKVTRPHSVFNDIHNDNVATYYSTSTTEFTTYDTFALKIVLLSNNSYIVPRLNDIRAIGVSA